MLKTDDFLKSRRNSNQLQYEPGGRCITPDDVLSTIVETNEQISNLHKQCPVPLFQMLGLRNLSGFVGEFFICTMQKQCPKLMKNKHQDGYPDLVALTPEGVKYLMLSKNDIRHKKHWSPYRFGGVEVKATCGAVKKTLPFGETRIDSLTGVDWKSHHRNTDNLLGLFWDFMEDIPTIMAAFYRNDLCENDWGKVVVPKNGSKTTSISILSRAGVSKMGSGWLVLPKDRKYRKKLEERVGFVCFL
jgi:hypothetical protein